MPFGVTVTRHRRIPAGSDRYMNTTYADQDSHIEGCAVWPTGTSELVQSQDTVRADLTVLSPEPDVLATDEFTVYGLRYKVNGQPSFWSSPITGTTGGTEIPLTRITG
jgi:hypothetical protein